MVQNELNLCRPANAIKSFKMCAREHDGVAIGKDEGPLEQAPLLHALNGMRQFDVLDIDKLMPREQADAVMASTEPDGGSELPLHTAIIGQLGDEIAVILMWAIGTLGVVIHFLQSDKVGLVLLDELSYLLQVGIMASMDIKGHDPDGIVVTLSRGRTCQQPCRNQKYITESHS